VTGNGGSEGIICSVNCASKLLDVKKFNGLGFFGLYISNLSECLFLGFQGYVFRDSVKKTHQRKFSKCPILIFRK
jgi:hypothetical protein